MTVKPLGIVCFILSIPTFHTEPVFLIQQRHLNSNKGVKGIPNQGEYSNRI